MKIVTDCGAEFTPEELAALEITQAPLYIQFPEGEINSAEIGPDALYDRLESLYPNIPTTAQPSSGIFAEIYRKLCLLDREILSIHISSGLSGTLQAARLGSEQARCQAAISLFDSMTLSGAQRFQVQAAAWAARLGWARESILNRLEKIRAHSEAIFTLESLDYLARGGRIGRVAALAGSLLKIKPIIHVDHADGKYTTIGKTRTISLALEGITNHLLKMYGTTALWVNVMHGRFFEPAMALSQMLKERLQVSRLDILRVSPVLGVHTGPGVVGAAVVPAELMENLG